MTTNRCWSALLLVSLGFAGGTTAATLVNRSPVTTTDAERALQELNSEIGSWNCRWEYLDAEGEVASTIEGKEEFESVFGDQVLRVKTSVPATGHQSQGLKFFNSVQQRILHIDVDPKGDHWILEQDLTSGQILSQPHKDKGGTTTQVRFTTLEEEEDYRRVLMEHTTDQGKTWTKGFYQIMERDLD